MLAAVSGIFQNCCCFGVPFFISQLAVWWKHNVMNLVCLVVMGSRLFMAAVLAGYLLLKTFNTKLAFVAVLELLNRVAGDPRPALNFHAPSVPQGRTVSKQAQIAPCALQGRAASKEAEAAPPAQLGRTVPPPILAPNVLQGRTTPLPEAFLHRPASRAQWERTILQLAPARFQIAPNALQELSMISLVCQD
jgi:hypothetical protein